MNIQVTEKELWVTLYTFTLVWLFAMVISK